MMLFNRPKRNKDSEDLISFSDMKVGQLYYHAEGDYHTLFTKTLSDGLLWFEDKSNGSWRVNTSGSTEGKFVEAPKGTYVAFC